MTDREIKIVFQPGCFDDFEGSQEELDNLVKEIQNVVADGSLFENSIFLTEDDLDDLPPEVLASIARDLEIIEDIDSVEEIRNRKLN